MTDSKALIERLWEVGRDGVWKSGRNRATAHPMCIEAADAIERLEADNARLREALQTIADTDCYWRTRSRQSLATGDTHYDDVLEIGRYAKTARAALQETSHD